MGCGEDWGRVVGMMMVTMGGADSEDEKLQVPFPLSSPLTFLRPSLPPFTTVRKHQFQSGGGGVLRVTAAGGVEGREKREE